MHACHYPRGHHDAAQGSTVARHSVACTLAALLTLAAPGAGGIGIALANPIAPAADGPGYTLISQNALESRTTHKVTRITRKKALIDERTALDIALRDLDIKKEDVDEIEVELEGDETVPVFEVELHIDNIEHEYEIDAYTGEIASHSREWEGDSPWPTIVRKD